MKCPSRAVAASIAAVAFVASGVVLATRSGGHPTLHLAASNTARPSAPPATLAKSTRVLALGDSNLAWAEVSVGAELRAAGIVGELRGLSNHGLKDLESVWLPLVPGLVQAQDPDVVVVALGTNDVSRVENVESFPARLDRMMQAIGDRRVIWITHFDDRYGVAFSAKRINDAIRAAPTRWANLTVLDLAPLINADTALLLPDLLHFSPSGQEFYARAIAVAVSQVAGAPPAPSGRG